MNSMSQAFAWGIHSLHEAPVLRKLTFSVEILYYRTLRGTCCHTEIGINCFTEEVAIELDFDQ